MTSGKSDSKGCLKMLASKGGHKFCRIAGFSLINCDAMCPLLNTYNYIFGGEAVTQELRCPRPEIAKISVG